MNPLELTPIGSDLGGALVVAVCLAALWGVLAVIGKIADRK